MTRVVLLLGGNIGSVEQTFAAVRCDLESEVGSIVGSSSLMRSEPWGYKSSREFLNQAVELSTALNPLALLDATQQIEQRWGRDRGGEQHAKERYSDRTIDIDIIFYGQEIISCERLTVPHKLAGERRFVLEPLAEIMPDFIHPACGKSIAEMLKDLDS